MNNQEKNQDRDHWADLASQLGLPPTSQAEPVPAPRAQWEPKPEVQEVVPKVREEIAPEEDWEAEGPESVSEIVPAYQPVAEEDALPDDPAEDLGEAAGLEPAPAAEGLEAKGPRRGRRRGRRSGKKAETTGEDTGKKTEEHVEADDEGLGAAPRRGRGRKQPRPEKTAAAELESPGELEEAKDDANDEELDNLSDWNVPSWNELIASLYRPDR